MFGREKLTWILDRRYDHLETVRVGAPAIGDILQGDKVGSRIQSAHRLFRIPTRQIRLQRRGMRDVLINMISGM